MGNREHLTCGIDPGAGAVKVAIVRSRAGADGEVLATSVQRVRRRDIRAVVRAAFGEACNRAAIDPASFAYVASTGDGDSVEFRTGHFYSMTTHARGALFLNPEARAVLDVGALHARALRINEQGRVLGHRMTSQCASGSGQFVENIARYLGVALEDVGELSRSAEEPEKVSSVCAVLAETDVINMVSRDIGTANILKGIHLSIAGRLIKLLRAIRCEGTVVATGGMSHDSGLLAALRELVAEEKTRRRKRHADVDLFTHEHGILAGAIGAGLLGGFRYDQLERQGRLELVAGAPPPIQTAERTTATGGIRA